MISQFIFPILCIVSIFLVWGAYCLPFSLRGKCLFFIFSLFGLAYIVPIGPFLDPIKILPSPLPVCLTLISAFSFFYLWSKVMHLSITLLFCVISIGFKPFRPYGKKLFLSRKINTALILACILLSGTAVYSTLSVPNVKTVTLYCKNLPPELDGYRIAHMTDTHIGPLFPKKWTEQVTDKIMAEKPDLIVHTGDIGDERPQDIAEHLAPLKKLSAPDGVYFIFGNHENYHGLSYWQTYFQEQKLRGLENESVLVRDNLAVIGAKSQPHYQTINFQDLLHSVPEHAFKIYLDHYPLRFKNSAEFIDLQLSGHTHGGTVLFLAPLVAKFNGGFLGGAYGLHDAKLYVGKGTGVWSYTPFRFFVSSEITLLILKRKK